MVLPVCLAPMSGIETGWSSLNASPDDDTQLALNFAAQARHHARRQRVVEAEGVADRQALLPHPGPQTLSLSPRTTGRSSSCATTAAGLRGPGRISHHLSLCPVELLGFNSQVLRLPSIPLRSPPGTGKVRMAHKG